MAWVTAGLAVLGGLSAFMGSSSQADAARARNEARIAQAKAQWEWDSLQYGRQETIADINYAWDMAKHNALLATEAQQKVDYEWAQGKMLENAKANLALNAEAITDKYVEGEKIRLKQETLAYQSEVAALQQGLFADMAQYVNKVQQNSLAANKVVQQSTEEVQTLMSSITLDNQADLLQRDIESVAAMVDQGNVKARMYSRGGGTSTARQAQQNIAKELGRSFGQLKIEQSKRNAAIDQRNAAMKGSTATQLAQYAKASQGILQQAEFNIDKVNMQTTDLKNIWEQVTIPGFKLANKAGIRELKSLAIQTQAAMDNASMPWRDSIKFEPTRALPGLKKLEGAYAPTLEDVPSTGDAILAGVMGAAQGALQGATTNSNGDLKFL